MFSITPKSLIFGAIYEKNVLFPMIMVETFCATLTATGYPYYFLLTAYLNKIFHSIIVFNWKF